MTFEINYLAVLVAAIANMVIGAFWYSPVLFGKKWMALSGITKEKMGAHPNMWMYYVAGFIVSLVMSFVLAHVLQLGSTTLSLALQTAFWMWLGFMATISLNAVIWGGRPKALWVLDNGYYLVSMLVMSAILFSWK